MRHATNMLDTHVAILAGLFRNFWILNMINNYKFGFRALIHPPAQAVDGHAEVFLEDVRGQAE